MVIESRSVNAVTYPGGLIVVFTPLIRLTSLPEELAAVLAHEMGHVAHRDPLKQMEKELGATVMLAMVNGGKSPPMAETLVKQFLEVQYTRQQEAAADAYAFQLLADAHISPEYFASFMQKLASDTLAEKTTTDYFSTHPDVHDRVKEAQEAAKIFDRRSAVKIVLDWDAVKRSLPSIFDQ